MRKILVAIVAATVAATPVMAQRAAPPAPAPAREHVQGSELSGGFILPLIGVVAVVLAILAATHKFPFGRNHPVSP